MKMLSTTHATSIDACVKVANEKLVSKEMFVGGGVGGGGGCV